MRNNKGQFEKGHTKPKEMMEKISNSLRGNKCHLGCKHSDESRKKMSESHIGIQAGEKHPMFGKKQSQEVCEKISVALTGKYNGENSRHWKGGDWRYWKKMCLTRDDYTCQICGLREPEIMDVDHIIPKTINPELKFEMSNLMVLCPNCHRRKTNRDFYNKL
jgi:hypothetical protein